MKEQCKSMKPVIFQTDVKGVRPCEIHMIEPRALCLYNVVKVMSSLRRFS